MSMMPIHLMPNDALVINAQDKQDKPSLLYYDGSTKCWSEIHLPAGTTWHLVDSFTLAEYGRLQSEGAYRRQGWLMNLRRWIGKYI